MREITRNAPRRLSLLVLSIFIILFGAGCGGSNADIIVNNSGGGGVAPPAPGTTGNLAFRFAQAQAATLPRGSVLLDFNFFSADSDLEVFFEAAEFAPTVTIENVPVNATRVVITAYGPGRVPLAAIVADVDVVADTTTVVDLSQVEIQQVTFTELLVDPVSVSLTLPGSASAQLSLSGRFSNADVVPFDDEVEGAATFVSANPAIATVSADGRVTGVAAGSTTVDVSYTLNGQTQTKAGIPVQVTGSLPPAPPTIPARLVIDPAMVNLTAGATTNVKVNYFAANSATAVDVTSSTVGTSSVAGLSYSAGQITVANTLPVPTSALLTVTYTTGGVEVSGRVVVNVMPPTPPVPPAPLGRLEVDTEALTFNNDGLLGLLDPELGGSGFFKASFTPNGTTKALDVTPFIGVSFSDFFPATVTSASFSYLNSSILAVPGDTTGVVFTSNPLGPTPPIGATATMTVTYIYQGVAHTDDVKITVGQPTIESVDFAVAPTGTLRLPADTTEYPVGAFINYTNGFRVNAIFGGPGVTDPYGNYLDLSTDATGKILTRSSVDSQTYVLNTGASSQSATVSAFLNGSATPISSFQLVVDDSIGASTVELVIDEPAINQRTDYRVLLTYSDGSTQDATSAYKLRFPGSAQDFAQPVFSDNNVARVYEGILIGIQLTTTPERVGLRPPGNQDFQLGGGGNPPNPPAVAFTVTAVDPSYIP